MRRDYFSSIINTKTGNPVCDGYTYKLIDLNKSEIEVGKELLIEYKRGTHFKHYEKVINISIGFNTTIVYTNKKTWTITHDNFGGGDISNDTVLIS